MQYIQHAIYCTVGTWLPWSINFNWHSVVRTATASIIHIEKSEWDALPQWGTIQFSRGTVNEHNLIGMGISGGTIAQKPLGKTLIRSSHTVCQGYKRPHNVGGPCQGQNPCSPFYISTTLMGTISEMVSIQYIYVSQFSEELSGDGSALPKLMMWIVLCRHVC